MNALAAEALYARGLGGDAVFVRREDGQRIRLPLERWLGPMTAADHSALARACAPVLDVGCGPGRHVRALARRGILALGVDASPAASRYARRRGAQVFTGSVFDRVPGAGRWGSALLLDGNIGIGGRPDLLLRRVAALLGADGRVICELDAPAEPTTRELVRLEDAGQARSGWFPWARVSVESARRTAALAGLCLVESWCVQERWFAVLAAR
jgi:SAM-dependent methyltransferase